MTTEKDEQASSTPTAGRWVLRRWIEPHPSLTRSDEKRRARLLAAMLLALFLLGIVVDAAFLGLELDQGTPPDPGTLALEVATSVLLFVGYRFSRSPRYEVGGFFLLGVPLGALWGLWLADAGSPESQILVYYLAIPIMMTPFALRFRSAVTLVTLNLLALAVLEPLVAGKAGDGYARIEYASGFWFLVLVSAVAVVAARLIDHDLRALEHSERELRSANGRLQDIDRDRLQFVNNVAHDLASPLSPVKIQLSLLEGQPDATPERIQHRIGVMKRNIGHVERLVMDLKDSAKLEFQRLNLQREPTDVAQLVRQACEDFQHEARKQQLELECEAPGPLVADADAQRITQVLYNLLTNALKFTPSGGRVRLEATRLDDKISVTITDSGRGLSSEEMPQLFRPFSQVHKPGESRERGTGLGLFISKGLVEAHGGTLKVASPGRQKGSTFTLTLPAAPEKANGGAGPP